MAGTTSSLRGVFVDFLTPKLPNIGREPKIEALIKLHILISGNVASVASNLGEFQNGHLTLTMTEEDYMAKTGYAFVSPHNPGH